MTGRNEERVVVDAAAVDASDDVAPLVEYVPGWTSTQFQKRLLALFEDFGGDGEPTEFVTRCREATRLISVHADFPPDRELGRRPSAIRKELDRVARVLDELSPEARQWLTAGAASADPVADMIARARTATPSPRRPGRIPDPIRKLLANSAAQILGEHDIAVTDSRSGPFDGLLSILIEALGLRHEAHSIAREFASEHMPDVGG